MDDGWGIRLQSPLSVPGVWPATDEALRVQIAPSLAQVSVVVTGATGTTLDLNYKGLPGNQPTTYQNFVAVWQGTIVPWNQPPMRTMKIPGNFVEGSLVVDGVQIAELAYTVGYGVGPEITEICASAILGVGAQTGPTDSVSLSLNRVGTTSVSVHYSVLDGYLPATNHNWLGLWNGRVNPAAAGPRPRADGHERGRRGVQRGGDHPRHDLHPGLLHGRESPHRGGDPHLRDRRRLTENAAGEVSGPVRGRAPPHQEKRTCPTS